MRWAAEAAEAVGTFLLVFLGCGAILVDALYGGLGLLGIALVFGLTVSAVIYAFAHISNAHINPAVTIAFASSGAFPWSRVPTYVLAQLTGALAGGLLLRALWGNTAALGTPLPAAGTSASVVWVLEAVFTLVLVLVMAGCMGDRRAQRSMGGWTVGSVIAVASLVAGPVTGAGINPARSLGPAIAATTLHSITPYLVAPLIGGILGAWIYRSLGRGAIPGSEEETLAGRREHINKVLRGSE